MAVNFSSSRSNVFISVEFSSVLFSVFTTERLPVGFHLVRAAEVCKIGLIVLITGQKMD